MKTVYLNASYFPAVELLAAVGTAVILLYGGSQAIDGAIQIGVIVAFVGYLTTFFEPIQELSQLYTTYQQGMAALDKIFDLLDTEPDMVDAPGRDRPGDAARRDRAWRASGSPTPTSDGAEPTTTGRCGTSTSTCRRGRRWRWSAPPAPASRPSRSWSPASTTRSRGRVLVDGHDLRGVQQRALRRQLGIVPQEGFLFSGSVRENIAFGRPGGEPGGDRGGDRRGRRHRVRRRPARRDRDRGRRARRPALGRPAPARRLRPRPARRAPHPDPRRGDLQRRRPHREDDRAGLERLLARPHRDRHRPPPLDDPPRRQDRRPRGRQDRRAGHPRRADRGRRRPTPASTAPGPSRPPRAAVRTGGSRRRPGAASALVGRSAQPLEGRTALTQCSRSVVLTTYLVERNREVAAHADSSRGSFVHHVRTRNHSSRIPTRRSASELDPAMRGKSEALQLSSRSAAVEEGWVSLAPGVLSSHRSARESGQLAARNPGSRGTPTPPYRQDLLSRGRLRPIAAAGFAAAARFGGDFGAAAGAAGFGRHFFFGDDFFFGRRFFIRVRLRRRLLPTLRVLRRLPDGAAGVGALGPSLQSSKP